MKLKAYAKLNLVFKITGIKANGYHTVYSINQSVDLSDTVEINLGDTISISCNDSNVPVDEGNTCYRAVKCFCEHTKTKVGADIKIDKKIPIQAGMGGGSADAGAVIIGMNKLLKLNLDTKTLIEIGAKIGADIPFSIVGGTACCRGIGEEITPMPLLTTGTFVIIKPEHGISTANAFFEYDGFLKRLYNKPEIELNEIYHLHCRHGADHSAEHNGIISYIQAQDIQKIGGILYNDFEQIHQYRDELSQIKNDLLSIGAKGVLMTGSGSAIYGLFSGEIQDSAIAVLSEKYDKIYICRPSKPNCI